MSNIDLDSLQSAHEADTNQYTDIEDVYGIDVFKKDNNDLNRIDTSKIFVSDNTKQSAIDTTKLFSTKETTGETNDDTGFSFSLDLGFIIFMIIALSLVILLFRRLSKNEDSS